MAAQVPPQPARPVAVYDGQCRFCLKQVDRFKSRDVDGVFEFLPRQVDGLLDRFPQLAGEDFNTGLRLVRTDGSVAVGADAVYEMARRVRGFRRLAWMYRIPGLRGLFRWMYGQVAKRRYRLAGKCEDGVCSVDS